MVWHDSMKIPNNISPSAHANTLNCLKGSSPENMLKSYLRQAVGEHMGIPINQSAHQEFIVKLQKWLVTVEVRTKESIEEKQENENKNNDKN